MLSRLSEQAQLELTYTRGGMKNIVQLHIVKREREASQEALWQRFAEATEKAKESGKLEDGIAAGKAYAAFCESFLTKRAG